MQLWFLRPKNYRKKKELCKRFLNKKHYRSKAKQDAFIKIELLIQQEMQNKQMKMIEKAKQDMIQKGKQKNEQLKK